VVKLDFWYQELLYHQTPTGNLELCPRYDSVDRPTPVLKSARPAIHFLGERKRKRKPVEEEIIVYEKDEGEFDNRLDGAYWNCSTPTRAHRPRKF
jgi:hypothetical protein